MQQWYQHFLYLGFDEAVGVLAGAWLPARQDGGGEACFGETGTENEVLLFALKSEPPFYAKSCQALDHMTVRHKGISWNFLSHCAQMGISPIRFWKQTSSDVPAQSGWDLNSSRIWFS